MEFCPESESLCFSPGFREPRFVIYMLYISHRIIGENQLIVWTNLIGESADMLVHFVGMFSEKFRLREQIMGGFQWPVTIGEQIHIEGQRCH